MSDSCALTPPRRPGPPATLEERSLMRAYVAAYHDGPTPQGADPDVVLVTDDSGAVTVYPPSEKLVILAAHRARRDAAKLLASIAPPIIPSLG